MISVPPLLQASTARYSRAHSLDLDSLDTLDSPMVALTMAHPCPSLRTSTLSAGNPAAISSSLRGVGVEVGVGEKHPTQKAS